MGYELCNYPSLGSETVNCRRLFLGMSVERNTHFNQIIVSSENRLHEDEIF